MKLINVRGCNGSGKTTLLRKAAAGVSMVEYIQVPDHKPVPITYTSSDWAFIGDYSPAASGQTTAGLDRIKTQAAAKAAIELVAKFRPDLKAVLFEGVVVSTIYGPWKEWSQNCTRDGMIWAFLDTPLDVCLRRIQERNGGKPIKEDQVADKHRTIARVRQKALTDGEQVVDLRWESPLDDLLKLVNEVVE